MVQEGGRTREAPSETGRRRVLREEDLDRCRVSQRFDRKMRGERPKMRQMLRGQIVRWKLGKISTDEPIGMQLSAILRCRNCL